MNGAFCDILLNTRQLFLKIRFKKKILLNFFCKRLGELIDKSIKEYQIEGHL